MTRGKVVLVPFPFDDLELLDTDIVLDQEDPGFAPP
jgi:hypothetical protein